MTLRGDCDGGIEDHDDPRTVGRRTVLAGLATATVGATAGCTAIVDAIANQVLGDVNLFNETERALSGTVSLRGPEGDDVLSTTFELAAQTGDEPTDGASLAHEDVWQAAGQYELAVELDDGQSVRGESSHAETVDIAEPDEEMLAVAFGAPDVDAGIYVAVGTSLSEFHPGSRRTPTPTPGA